MNFKEKATAYTMTKTNKFNIKEIGRTINFMGKEF